MDNSVLKGLKKVLESLVHLKNSSSQEDDDESTLKLSEALSSSSITPMGSISEGILAQNIPKSSFHPGLQLSDNMFHIKNLNTGQEIRLNNEGFFGVLNEYLTNEKYAEAMDHIFSQKEKMNTALLEAANNNDPDLCRLLLDKKNYGDIAAEPNGKDFLGMTALHISAKKGFIKVCEILLDYGFMTDLNAKDANGRTPLHLACIEAQLGTAQLLIRSGAHMNAVDQFLNTPMHYAVERGDKEFLS